MCFRQRVLVIGVIAALAGPAIAFAASTHDRSDSGAASAYFRARDALLLRARSELPTVRAATDRVVLDASNHCPEILSKAPRGAELDALNKTIALALAVTAFHIHRDAISNFARVIRQLRWHNIALATFVRAAVAQNEAETRVRVPDLCAESREWAAGDYQTVPPSAILFMRKIEAITNAPRLNFGSPLKSDNENIAGALGRYVGQPERVLVRGIAHLELTVGGAEARILLAAVTRLRVVLGAIGPAP